MSQSAKFTLQQQAHVHLKMKQTFYENRFTIEEPNYEQTHIPVTHGCYFSKT